MKYLIDIIVLIALYFIVFFRRWNAKEKYVLLIKTFMYIYISFVLFFTLMPIVVSLPFIFNHPYIPMELTPFSDVIGERGDFIRQVVLNVVMMIPFGFLYPLTQHKKRVFLKTILFTFLFSLCIELLQPLINGLRSSDITDLITNTIGGIMGYVFYVLLWPITSKVITYVHKK